MPKKREFRTVRGYQLLKQSRGSELTPSMEDYLEMIYRTCQHSPSVRVNALAQQLNVQAPSVTRTVRRLAEQGYVIYQKYGVIELTAKGEQLGKYLLARHETIEQFLSNLGVRASLLVDTELIEHYLSSETVRSMEAWNAFLAENEDVLERFAEFWQQYATNNKPLC
ncbi:MAG: MarR family transcriptional regulator [Firmicutes bacterium]|nr:MarR family transcriptional regulator [Bacillota bacterium]